MSTAYDAPEPCSGELKDCRIALPDIVEVLERIRLDVLSVSKPADVEPLARRLRDLRDDVEAMPLAAGIDCGYDGEVDDYRFVRTAGLVLWTCPRCGYQNESDAPEADPDAARDAMLDRMDWKDGS